MLAGPALATTTFAQYKQLDNVDTVAFADGALTGTGRVVEFNFLDAMPADVDGNIDAIMQFTASGLDDYSGVLSFLRVGDLANLLTVEFSGAELFGAGTAASFLNSDPVPGSITYTSAFIDFSDATAADFSLSFSGLSSTFGSPAWTADSVGTFASDSRGIPGAIPEPATWGLMIMGFGGMGAIMRQRRSMVRLA
ncbi:MAG: PEPxxWA-CTERM sorting domain-containing protein [Phenylobacterium sp.]|nr:PEPxxWA-CTERM sorting domain-containing protein [Phenylobacterium sp.]